MTIHIDPDGSLAIITKIAGIAIGGFSLLYAILYWATYIPPEKVHRMYSAWTNAAQSPISYDEWELLKSNDMLPGQPRTQVTPVATPTYVPIR